MRKSRPLRLLLALLAAVAMIGAACGDSDEGDSSTEPTPPADDSGSTDESGSAADEGEPFRIAIVSPSARNDVAFSQSIFDAVDRMSAERNIEVSASDGLFVVEDAAAAIRGYAEEGVDLVIAHGSQYGGPLQEIAPDFPDVAFTWGTSTDTFGLENVSAYTVQADQGGYAQGVMGAALSESGRIGIIGPVEVGDAKLYVDGFAAGAEAHSPEINVTANYIESFSDVALAQEAATAFVSNGADILTGTAQMVVGATGISVSEGVPWFGTQSNQTSLGPDVVVSSQVYRWEVALEPLIDDITSGSLGGQSYVLTLANGGLELEFNEQFDLDPEIRALGEETVAGIIDGSITTGVGE